MRSQLGFSLVELITVMVIAGILSSVAIPRFFSRHNFDREGYRAEARAAVRYAHKHALASGCSIRVAFSALGYRIERWQGGSDCNDRSGTLTPLVSPNGDEFIGRAPSGVSVANASLYFDRIGRPHDPTSGALLTSALSIQIGTKSLRIAAETGLVQ